jgi:hypothetical protein
VRTNSVRVLRESIGLTGVVEGHVGVEGDFHGLRLALATQLAAVAIVCLLLEAAVDEGVEFCGGHVCLITWC